MLFGFIHLSNPYLIFGMITAFIMLNLALMIFVGSKEAVPRLFALATFFSAMWTIVISLDYGAFALQDNYTNLYFQELNPTSYAIGLCAAVSFFYFCYRMTTKDSLKTSSLIKNTLLVGTVAVLPLFFTTDLIVSGYDIQGPLPKTVEEALTPASIDAVKYLTEYGPLISVYNLVFLGLLITGVFLLWKKKQKTTDLLYKKQLSYMFWALTIGFTAAGITNILLPVITNTDYGYIGMFTGNVWVFLVGYSIVKYNQMNIRVIFAELLVVLATLLLFITIFI